LIEPASDSSSVSKILAKSGVSPYHFCYEVKDIDEAILSLKNSRFILLSKPVNAVAIDNRLICFCYNKSFGLIELVQV
jgi:methylmalonyl-CoA/ethylmalonyl-CoA epimerase